MTKMVAVHIGFILLAMQFVLRVCGQNTTATAPAVNNITTVSPVNTTMKDSNMSGVPGGVNSSMTTVAHVTTSNLINGTTNSPGVTVATSGVTLPASDVTTMPPVATTSVISNPKAASVFLQSSLFTVLILVVGSLLQGYC